MIADEVADDGGGIVVASADNMEPQMWEILSAVDHIAFADVAERIADDLPLRGRNFVFDVGISISVLD